MELSSREKISSSAKSPPKSLVVVEADLPSLILVSVLLLAEEDFTTLAENASFDVLMRDQVASLSKWALSSPDSLARLTNAYAE